MASMSNTSHTGSGPEPVPPAASAVTVEDLSNPAAPAAPVPPSVSALVQEADAIDVGAVPTADASAVTTTSVVADPPVPNGNAPALAQEGDPSVKKMIRERAAIAEVQELSAPVDLPTFKHVPGVGLVLETPASPDTTVFGTVSGDDAGSKEAEGGGSRGTTADVVTNDAEPTAIVVPASEDLTVPKTPAPPPPASTAVDSDNNKEKSKETPAAINAVSEVPVIGDATTGSEYASASSSPRGTIDGLPGGGREENVLLSTAAQMVRFRSRDATAF
jgi:hypothetical protein